VTGVQTCALPICCLPPEQETEAEAEKSGADAAELAGAAGAAGAAFAKISDQAEQEPSNENDGRPLYHRFSVSGAIREAWEKTKGAKGAIWAGSAMMYLVVLLTLVVVSVLAKVFSTMDNPIVGTIGTSFFQFLGDMVGTIFIGGLLHMGIKKATGHPIEWKMVFAGFSKAGRIVVAAMLSGIMILLGFLLLILPGIYLCVGYGLAIPLIIEKNFSPWQALEASRKAIHKIWWKVFALWLCMFIVNMLAALPLGIGLIWTVPMSFVAIGVVYRHLFPSEERKAD
jgi:hypothetical protein